MFFKLRSELVLSVFITTSSTSFHQSYVRYMFPSDFWKVWQLSACKMHLHLPAYNGDWHVFISWRGGFSLLWLAFSPTLPLVGLYASESRTDSHILGSNVLTSVWLETFVFLLWNESVWKNLICVFFHINAFSIIIFINIFFLFLKTSLLVLFFRFKWLIYLKLFYRRWMKDRNGYFGSHWYSINKEY